MFKDYYKILDISQNATDEEIKKAFREQAIKWHPDRNQGIDTTLRMQEINEAYLILKDKEARTRYDIEYNKFKQHQERQQKNTTENEKAKSESQHKHQEEKQSNRQYEYSDFKVEDDLLEKWMANAKRQSVELAKQTIRDFKGVTKAAANGCVNGIVQLVIWVVVINLIVLLFRTCSN